MSASRNYQATCREAGMIIWVQLLEGQHTNLSPNKIWADKNVLARFLTTFDFDCEYLRNGLTETWQKSEKQVINYNPSDVGQKKVGEFWSTNSKVTGANVDPSGILWETTFWHLGCAAPQIFTWATTPKLYGYSLVTHVCQLHSWICGAGGLNLGSAPYLPYLTESKTTQWRSKVDWTVNHNLV